MKKFCMLFIFFGIIGGLVIIIRSWQQFLLQGADLLLGVVIGVGFAMLMSAVGLGLWNLITTRESTENIENILREKESK